MSNVVALTFCKLNETILESKTGILTNKLSDHQPYFMSVNVTQKKEPLPEYVKINIVSTEAMHNVRHEIKSEEIYNKFNKKNQPPILTQIIIHYVMKFCAPKTNTWPVNG